MYQPDLSSSYPYQPLVLISTAQYITGLRSKTTSANVNKSNTHASFGAWSPVRTVRLGPDTLSRDTSAVWMDAGQMMTTRSSDTQTQTNKERKKTDNPREGWEDGTPPPHRDFKEGTVWWLVLAVTYPWAPASSYLSSQSVADSRCNPHATPRSSYSRRSPSRRFFLAFPARGGQFL